MYIKKTTAKNDKLRKKPSQHKFQINLEWHITVGQRSGSPVLPMTLLYIGINKVVNDRLHSDMECTS